MFRHEAKYQLALLLGPAILGLWAGLFLSHFGSYSLIAVSIAAIGFGFLFSAKLSEKKRTKKLISWGSSGMTIREKTSYFLGVLLMVIYFLLSIYLALHPIIN